MWLLLCVPCVGLDSVRGALVGLASPAAVYQLADCCIILHPSGDAAGVAAAAAAAAAVLVVAYHAPEIRARPKPRQQKQARRSNRERSIHRYRCSVRGSCVCVKAADGSTAADRARQRSEVVHLEAAAEADEKKPTTPTTDDEA